MVESSELASNWPDFYQPFRNIRRIELPGVDPDDIDLSLNDSQLTVRGEKRSEREEKGRDYYFSEREYGAFQRTFRLPQDSDGENIQASFTNGVLNLKIGKQAKAKSKGKKIEIQSN